MSTVASWGASELATRIPEGFQGAAPRVQTGSGMGRVHEALHSTPEWALLWRISKPRLILSRPLRVRVYVEGGFAFAENESLGICGTGLTVDAAILDFTMHVAHFHKYYQSLSTDQVEGEAARLKQLFAELVRE